MCPISTTSTILFNYTCIFSFLIISDTQIRPKEQTIKHTCNPPSAYLPNSCVYFFGTPWFSPPYNNYSDYLSNNSNYWGQPMGGWLEKDLLKGLGWYTLHQSLNLQV